MKAEEQVSKRGGSMVRTQRGWFNGRAMVGAVAVLGFAYSAGAQTDFGATYGGRAGSNALLPWFEAGPAAGDTRRDTLIAIVHDDQNIPITGEFIHVRLFDVSSNEACDICEEVTREDVYTGSIFEIITRICGPAGMNALDAGDGAINGVFRGYALFEPSQNSSCSTIDQEGDLVPYFYQTQLQRGVASGFTGPVYEDDAPLNNAADFEEYALEPGGRLYFRILVGLDSNQPNVPGADDLAETTVVVWSDRTGACGPSPDSFCLVGLSNQQELRVCDEAENCTSQVKPELPLEVNFLRADDFVPNSFLTDGGWFVLQNPTPARLNVLGYSDNAANGLGPNLNFRAIFPAQRR